MTNCPRESFRVRVRPYQFFVAQVNRVHCATASCRFIRCVDLGQRSDLMWDGEINSDKVEVAQKRSADRSSFARMWKARILHIDVTGAQRRVLHLR